MKIKVNGKEQVLDAGSMSIEKLLKTVNVENPELVSVQLNGEFVVKEKRGVTGLKDGDEIDFLYFMGGGI
ncbi:MAG: sulfur carrier protein ThiS [Candidatus Omnitrophota bacterium]|nr:sulfur carrier protein ThiS [Candidatus Omnitrophota bacterium]